MESKDKLMLKQDLLLKRIKTFSSPEYKGVYTKSYFQEIEKVSIENSENTYAFIFGDFNKLGVINDIYGHEFGNRALEIAMKIIKKSLPSDASVVRAGGDEIYIILPDSNKENADKYINLINNNLQKNAALIGGLSIELASSDSTYGNTDKLIDITDNEITNIKAARKESNSPADVLSDDFIDLQVPKSTFSKDKDSWTQLNNLINISIYEFLKNFRPSKNFEFKPQQIVDSSDFVTNSFLYLLNDKTDGKLPKKLESLLRKEYPYLPDYSNSIMTKNNHKSLDVYDAELVKSFVTGKKSISDLNTLSEEDLKNLTQSSEKLLDNLTKDDTGLLNKHYFRQSLAQKLCSSDEKYSASYVSFLGLKLSNTAYGHNFSDYRLDKTNKIFIDETNKLLNCTNTAFDFKKDNIYFISFGGGNYLYLYPKNMEKDIQPKIVSIVNKVNSKFNIKDPNSNFEASYYSMKNNEVLPTFNVQHLIRYIRVLKEEANSKKNNYKRDLFKSADAYFAFKKTMNNCVDYYLDNISDAHTDVNKIVQFMKNVYISFLNQEALHNTSRVNMPDTGFSAYTKETNSDSNIEH